MFTYWKHAAEGVCGLRCPTCRQDLRQGKAGEAGTGSTFAVWTEQNGCGHVHPAPSSPECSLDGLTSFATTHLGRQIFIPPNNTLFKSYFLHIPSSALMPRVLFIVMNFWGQILAAYLHGVQCDLLGHLSTAY